MSWQEVLVIVAFVLVMREILAYWGCSLLEYWHQFLRFYRQAVSDE